MKKLLNIPKHQKGSLLRQLLKSRLKTIANLISDTPQNEQKLVQIARAAARATEKQDVKTIKNIDNLLQRELSYSLGRPVDGFPGAKPLEYMTDDELVKIIPEWRIQSAAPVIQTPQKTGPLSQEEIKILKNLYSKKPYDLTKEEVKLLQNLSRRQNGLIEPVDERIPSLAPFTTEGAVDSRYIYRNPSGSYDDLPTYLPTAPWNNSNNFYKQTGGTLTPQDQDISKFLKNYPVKYRRTSKGISPEDYAKYMKLMRTATGDDVVEFLLKEGYITFKNQTKKFQNPDGPIYFTTNYGTLDAQALRQNPYKLIKNGKLGVAYDLGTATLYGLSPIFPPAIFPATAMSAAKAGGAAVDMIDNGPDLENSLDLLTGVMPITVAKNAKNAIQAANRTRKVLKRSPLARQDYWSKIYRQNAKNAGSFTGIAVGNPFWNAVVKDQIDKEKQKQDILPQMVDKLINEQQYGK